MINESFSFVMADQQTFKPVVESSHPYGLAKLPEQVMVPNCRYIIDARLPDEGMGPPRGEGQTALVFWGYDSKSGNEIVIKIQKDSDNRVADTEGESPYIAEYKALRKLEELEVPNVVRAAEYTYIKGGDGNSLFPVVVLEGVKGENFIDHRFENTNELLTKHKEIASALDYMHSQGVIHRDLSPRHIVDSDKGVRIIDFGLSNLVLPDTPDNREYMVGSIGFSDLQMYSPNYLPDIDRWAFMAVLYHSFTGNTPLYDLKDHHTTIDQDNYIRALQDKKYKSLKGRENRLGLNDSQIEKLDMFFKDFFVEQKLYRNLTCTQLMEEVGKCLY